MTKRKEPFHHIAGLNLFRERDGTHEITTSSAGPTVFDEVPDDLKLIDHIENLILAAADRMKARKIADGTYRHMTPPVDRSPKGGDACGSIHESHGAGTAGAGLQDPTRTTAPSGEGVE